MEEQIQPQPKKRRTGLIVFIVILIIIVLVVGGYFLIKNLKNPSLEETIAKEDPTTGKSALLLIAEQDTEGMKRAKVTQKEVDLIIDLVENAEIEILTEAGADSYDVAAIASSGQVDMEKMEIAMEEKVQGIIDEGIAAVDLAQENR